MNKILIGVVVVVVLVGGFWFFNRAGAPAEEVVTGDVNQNMPVPPAGNEPPVTEKEVVQEPSAPAPTPGTPSVKEFTVQGSSFTFDVSQMTVKVGDRVRIVFKNTGGKHDWRLDEFDAATKVLDSGQSEAIEFTASKAGSFEYYCSVGSHRQMGMKGTLTVVDQVGGGRKEKEYESETP